MAMRIKTITYIFKEGFKNVWRNRAMSMASITSVAATLVILGVIFIMIININSMAQGAKDQFDTIQIYLSENLSKEQIDGIGTEIQTFEGVKEIRFQTKEEAMKKFKQEWGDKGYLLDDLDSNPLPNSYIITMTDIGFANHVVEQVKTVKGIEDVKYYQDVINKMIQITNFIRNVGMAVIVILIVISTMIIHNTIKLAVNARRREINIMKYVGATNWFVRMPFLLEGTILGVCGAFIAIVLVYFLYRYSYEMFTSEFYVIIAAYIVGVRYMIMDLLSLFVVIGAGIGALGSLLSMRKYLDV